MILFISTIKYYLNFTYFSGSTAWFQKLAVHKLLASSTNKVMLPRFNSSAAAVYIHRANNNK